MNDTQLAGQRHRPVQTLEDLARARFSYLKPAEIKLLRAAPLGEPVNCGPSADVDDPTNDPSEADHHWGQNREIRAELLRWLMTNAAALSCVDPSGIEIRGAKINGVLQLSSVDLRVPLSLVRCKLSYALLLSARIPFLSMRGSLVQSIAADGIRVEHDILLRDKFVAKGEVRLIGAQVGGDLDCHNAMFTGQDGPALTADRINVKGSVFLRDVVAEGEVSFVGAQIGGDFDCKCGTLRNYGGSALRADGMTVAGGIYLRDKSLAVGEVRFLGAQIGADLDCNGGTFRNPSDTALQADHVIVRGSAYFSGQFAADGEVRLVGAQIAGDLDCGDGTFDNGGGTALYADRINVKGDVFLRDKFTAKGTVRLVGAQIGGDLDCHAATLETVIAVNARVAGDFLWFEVSKPKSVSLTLNLVGASFSGVRDDESSWPTAGNMMLDGLVYQRLDGNAADARSRLRWLSLQEGFAQQPYRQLSKVLANAGDESGARLVLFELERRRRIEEDRTGVAKAWSSLLRTSIGYGYYPEQALWPLLGISGLGWIIYRRSYLAGAMAPTDKEAYQSFKENGVPPPYYRRFNPLVYSFENCAPLVNLGQTEHWAPDPSVRPRERSVPIINTGRPAWIRVVWGTATRVLRDLIRSPRFLQVLVWIQIVLGWVLATLFVAGVTGIVRKE